MKKLFGYMKLLAKDEDFDSHYLLVLIVHKLKYMEKHFRTKGMLANSEHHANVMASCIIIAERLLEDKYEDKYLKWNDKEYRLDGINGEILTTVEYAHCINNAHKDKNADIHNFFNTIRDNIELWWD